MKYKVIRQHYGDRQYYAGESREVANEHDAQTLIKMGLIAPFGGESENPTAEQKGKAKAKPAHKNKAETAPQNKAESDLDNKDAAE